MLIAMRVDDLRQSLIKAQNKKGHGVGPHSDGRVSFFDLQIGALCDTQSFRHHHDRQAALLTGERNVGAELAKRPLTLGGNVSVTVERIFVS